MPEPISPPVKSPRVRRVRTAPLVPTKEDQLHADLREATKALRDQTTAMREQSAVLAPVIAHIPTIVEMANAYSTGKAVTRTAQAIEAVLVRMSKVLLAIVVIYAAWKLDLKGLLGMAH